MAVAIAEVSAGKGWARCECGGLKAYRAKSCRPCADRARSAGYAFLPCRGYTTVIPNASPKSCGIEWRHRHCRACSEPQASYWKGICGLCVAEGMGLGRIVAGQGGMAEPLW